jgi:malate dehydrogenase (oxaloacetate-decarboxylating)(NADP+)
MFLKGNRGLKFFADTTVNYAPTSEVLAQIAIATSNLAREFNVEPRIAMLSYSNFGSVNESDPNRARRAVEIVRELRPDLEIDGEMHADVAVNAKILKEQHPYSKLSGDANVLIFPDLSSGNICYKLMRELGGSTAVGPILVGMKKPVVVLDRNCNVNDIVNMTAIVAVQAHKYI